jgi:hypothetical protein
VGTAIESFTRYVTLLYNSFRHFYLFFRYKKHGADLVCGVPGKNKNIFEKILSQESMR